MMRKKYPNIREYTLVYPIDVMSCVGKENIVNQHGNDHASHHAENQSQEEGLAFSI